MRDQYEYSGEYLDMLMASQWRTTGALLAAALAGTDVQTGPVVDVGAGSGRAVAVIGAALPRAEILAVEPSPLLRAVLLARVAADEDLRVRTTVVPRAILAARLPERVSAVTAMNMLGHLAPADRGRLWSLLAARLAPGGRVVLTLPGESELACPEPRCLDEQTVTVGRHRYETWSRSEPTGRGCLALAQTHRVYDGRELLEETTAVYDWWPIPEPELRAELASHGFTARGYGPVGACVYIAARAG